MSKATRPLRGLWSGCAFALASLACTLTLPVAAEKPIAYVAHLNESRASAVDVSSGEVLATFNTLGYADFVAIHPTRPLVYVATIGFIGGPAKLTVIDDRSKSIVQQVSLAFCVSDVVPSPDGSLLYVPTDCGLASIDVVDTSTYTIIDSLPIPAEASEGVIHPTSGLGYFILWELDQLAVIDLASGTVIETLPVGESPTQLAMSRDAGLIAVANYDGHSVSLLETASNSALPTIATDGAASDVVFSADGTLLYIAIEDPGVIIEHNLLTGDEVTIPVAPGRMFLALTGDGDRLVASNHNGSMYVVDTLSRQVVATYPVTGPFNLTEVGLIDDELFRDGFESGDLSAWTGF